MDLSFIYQWWSNNLDSTSRSCLTRSYIDGSTRWNSLVAKRYYQFIRRSQIALRSLICSRFSIFLFISSWTDWFSVFLLRSFTAHYRALGMANIFIESYPAMHLKCFYKNPMYRNWLHTITTPDINSIHQTKYFHSLVEIFRYFNV